MTLAKPHQPVPGTTIFDGEQARKGFALNKMCYSFNDAANRAAFVADEESYCARYTLQAPLPSAARCFKLVQAIGRGGRVMAGK